MIEAMTIPQFSEAQKQRVNDLFVSKATMTDVEALNGYTILASSFKSIDVPAENADQQAFSDSITSCKPDLNDALRSHHTVKAIETVTEVITREVAA